MLSNNWKRTMGANGTAAGADCHFETLGIIKLRVRRSNFSNDFFFYLGPLCFVRAYSLGNELLWPAFV